MSKANQMESSDVILTGLGACLALPDEKRKTPLVAIAYATGATEKEIFFTLMEAPRKGKLYTNDDFLAAVATAENTKHVTYTDTEGQQKSICFCRPAGGTVTDVIARDYDKNRYIGAVSEICAAQLKFALGDTLLTTLKVGKKAAADVTPSTGSTYPTNSLAFALINAYNACLLARTFEREELQLETKSKQRIKIEVRAENAAFIENEVLCITPIFREDGDLIDYYLTEKFHYIDGENISCRSYKIIYSNHLHDYNLVRQ